MPAAEAKILNTPLNGLELTNYICRVLDETLTKRNVLSQSQRGQVVEALRTSMRNDCFFSLQTIHANVICELAFQYHAADTRLAFTLAPKFTLPNNMNKVNEPFTRRPVGVSAPPLDGLASDVEQVADCFTLRVTVDNPNAVRVRCGMPIITVDKLDPKPGDIFPKFERREHYYDPNTAPPLPSVQVVEETPTYAMKWLLPGFELPERVEAIPEAEVIPRIVIDPPRFEDVYHGSAPDPTEDLGAEMMAEMEAEAEPVTVPPEPPKKRRGRPKKVQ